MGQKETHFARRGKVTHPDPAQTEALGGKSRRASEVAGRKSGRKSGSGDWENYGKD